MNESTADEPTSDGLEPAAVAGTIEVPCSKSLAQRAIVAAAFARGCTRFRALGGVPHRGLQAAHDAGPGGGADVAAAAAVAAAWTGRRELVAEGGVSRLAIEGTAGRRPFDRPRALEVGESGTLARLVSACVALAAPGDAETVIRPGGSLARRRSPALVEALNRAGARAVAAADATWPLTIRASAGFEALHLVRPSSSQELSALWLAAAARGGRTPVTVEGEVPSAPYLGLTEQVLGWFGARLEPLVGGGPFDRIVEGPLVAPGVELAIEPDASAAAVALAAGCLSGGDVRVPGIDGTTRQGDVRIIEHLRAFGCRAEIGSGGLHSGGRPSRPATLDLSGEPDLAPVLAAVAGAVALAHPGSERSLLTGLHTLPGKESSRIAVLAEGLRALGLEVDADEVSLAIGPGRGPCEPLTLDPHGDHRMAFAFALLGLVRPGVRVAGPGCVAKSWPGFFDDLRRQQDRTSSG